MKVPTEEELKSVSKQWLADSLEQALSAGEMAAELAATLHITVTELEKREGNLTTLIGQAQRQRQWPCVSASRTCECYWCNVLHRRLEPTNTPKN